MNSIFKSNLRALLFLGLTLALVGTSGARAQEPRWGDSFKYDNGVSPAVACDGVSVVEVHQGTNGVGPLWYRVGQINGSKIQWGNSAKYDDAGLKPAVAINNGRVLEVH